MYKWEKSASNWEKSEKPNRTLNDIFALVKTNSCLNPVNPAGELRITTANGMKILIV